MLRSQLTTYRSAARTAGISVRAAMIGAKTYTPLKPEIPLIVTQNDISDYLDLLLPTIRKFSDEDMVPIVIMADPAAERAKVKDLLAKAEKVDGCTKGLACPSDGSVTGLVAGPLREEAQARQDNAIDMEKRIASRGGITPEQLYAENRLWADWATYRRNFKEYYSCPDDSYCFTSESAFRKTQQFDIELQQFLDRYPLVMKGRVAKAEMVTQPTGVVDPWNPIAAAKGVTTSISNIIFWLGVGVTVYLGLVYVFPLFIGAAGSTKGAMTRYRQA